MVSAWEMLRSPHHLESSLRMAVCTPARRCADVPSSLVHLAAPCPIISPLAKSREQAQEASRSTPPPRLFVMEINYVSI